MASTIYGSSKSFGFSPVKYINLKKEVVTKRGHVRHYHSQARCNIQVLSLEQQRIFRDFQKKLGHSEKIVIKNDETRQKIETKRVSMVQLRKQNSDELHTLRMKRISTAPQTRSRPPPWKQNARAKTTDDAMTHKKKEEKHHEKETLQIRSKSRETIRLARHRFEDGARVISASFPRIKEAWVQNVETVTAKDYLKTFETNLTEEKYVRQNVQFYSIT